jgi:hypothetical protein
LPQLRVLSNCTNLIRTLPDAVYEDVEGLRATGAMVGEDLDTRGEDHALDAARYLLMHVYKPIIKNRVVGGWRDKLKKKSRKHHKGSIRFS